MTEYRSIAPQDWNEALRLWEEVFDEGGWLFQSLHEGTTERAWDHTRVALVDGQIVSAVDVFIRQIRGLDGNPVKVGAVGSVATLEAHRNQGHSGRLLRDAIEMMEREGCVWSFLFTGRHEHYARYGWKRQWLRYTVVNVAPLPRPWEASVSVRRVTREDGWPLEAFAGIYDRFNADRPMTHVRTPLYWRTAIRAQLERPERRVWTADRCGKVLGYAIAAHYEDRMNLEEVCIEPGADDALPGLFEEVRRDAAATGLSAAEVLLPHDSRLQAWVGVVFDNAEVRKHGWAMARSIGGRISDTQLSELFASPQAHNYAIDSF